MSKEVEYQLQVAGFDPSSDDKRSGKRGRGAEGKTAIMVAFEHNDGKSGFVAMKHVEGVTHNSVKQFIQQTITNSQILDTDTFAALRVFTEEHLHIAKVTPPEIASEWLPWVYVVIINFKSYLLGTYHGGSGCYMLEYLDEFCYRLNLCFLEKQIPNRLLRFCVTHQPVFL